MYPNRYVTHSSCRVSIRPKFINAALLRKDVNRKRTMSRIHSKPDERFWEKVAKAQEELRELENEREVSLQKGVLQVTRFSRRTERLLQSISDLNREASKEINIGNEHEARRILKAKAAIVQAVEKAQNRTAVHSALATKLNEVIEQKQKVLLDDILEISKSLSEDASTM